MVDIFEFNEKWKGLDLVQIIAEVVEENTTSIANLNKKQLLKGLNSEGQLLSPKYSEDPWFKSKEAAMRYAAWKKRLFPDSPENVPNLIIVGAYHNAISVEVNGDAAVYKDSTSFAQAIDAKYKGKQLGLNEQSLDTAWETVVNEPFVEKIANRTGAQAG